MSHRFRIFTIAACAAGFTLLADRVDARDVITRGVRPQPQRQVRSPAVFPATSWRGSHLGPHKIYGTITAMNGTILNVQTRSGRMRTIDATAAVARGDYSGPLFIGKLVSIDGNLQNGTFIATHVFRLNNLNQLAADR